MDLLGCPATTQVVGLSNSPQLLPKFQPITAPLGPLSQDSLPSLAKAPTRVVGRDLLCMRNFQLKYR